MKKYGTIFVSAIAVIALIMSLSASKGSSKSDVAQHVIDRGEIRVGYIIYPPSLIKDEKTGKLSGFSYDIVEAAAKNLNLKTNWVEEVGWGSAIEGLKMKRYDILGTQIWPNAARAREASFSMAPMYSQVFPYVKTGDYRLSADLKKLNSNQFTISLVDGEMATFIAKDDYPNAKTNTLPQLSSYAEVLMNITNGKADVAFAEPSIANDFLKSHPGKIQKLGNTPVRTFGLEFAFARGENSMVSMWNVALEELVNNGTIKRTLEKYGAENDYLLNIK